MQKLPLSLNRPPSIALGADGKAVIAYNSGFSAIPTFGDLVLAHCDDLACSTNTRAVVASGASARASDVQSIAIGAGGNVVIAYHVPTANSLKVAVVAHTAWAVNGWGR